MAIKVSTANPRYFEDNGKTILLAGSHTWYNLQPWSTRRNSVSEHIAVLKANNHNYVRGWVCTSLIIPWKADLSDPHRPLKMPYMRTGPGSAGDGEPKLDLTQFDESFFDDMYTRVKAYCDAGMYVSVMFDWSTMSYTDIKSVENNINNIVGTNDNAFVLRNMPDDIKDLHTNFVRKVIKTLGDLPNVFWEVGNELHQDSMPYQSWILDVVRNAETEYGVVSRPIGITAPGVRGWGTTSGDKAVNDALFASNADWISPVDSVSKSYEEGYSKNPPINDGSKVVLLDTDHLRDENMPRNAEAILYRHWAWKSFTRGLNITMMDDPWSMWDAPQTTNLQNGRNYVGDVRRYAERLDMARTIPSTSVCSTKYCLIGDGQYLIYQPAENGASFTVNVAPGEYDYEWFDPTARTVIDSGNMAVSPNTQFDTNRDMVLLLTKGSGEVPSMIPQTGWTLKYVSSEETEHKDQRATRAFDGDSNTFWHTKWVLSDPSMKYPHEIQINLGDVYDITGFRCLPRQDKNVCHIKGYEFYTSYNGTDWTFAASGQFSTGSSEKEVTFPERTGQYIKLIAISSITGDPGATIAELNVIGTESDVQPPAAHDINIVIPAGAELRIDGTLIDATTVARMLKVLKGFIK